MAFYVTLTGVDDNTSSVDIAHMDRGGAPPWFVEIGVLLSTSRAGTPRYPTLFGATRLMETVIDTGMRVAIHLCGHLAREVFSGRLPAEILDQVKLADKIQVNGDLPTSLDELVRIASQWPSKTWVLQSREDSFPPKPASNVTWLFDRSSGNGVLPESWPPHPGFEVGYAGGIGVGKIPPIQGPAWIDMESSLRNEQDRFSFEYAAQVLKEAWLLTIDGGP